MEFVGNMLGEFIELHVGTYKHLFISASLKQVDEEVVSPYKDEVWMPSLTDAVDVANIFLIRLKLRSKFCQCPEMIIVQGESLYNIEPLVAAEQEPLCASEPRMLVHFYWIKPFVSNLALQMG
jgi:hypothetical protein